MDMSFIDSLRQFRIGGFTIFDTAASLLGIYILSPLLTRLFRFVGLEIPQKNWLYLVLPIGIFVHYLSGNITPMTREFLDPSGYYFLKAVILILLILGFRRVKKVKKGKKP